MADRISIPVSMMDDQPLMFLRDRTEYEYPYHVCLAQNVKMEHVNYVDSREQHLQLIANGIAAGFVPEGSAGLYRNDKRIRLLHLTDDRFSRSMKACFKREKHLSSLAGVFKGFFIDYFNLPDERSQS